MRAERFITACRQMAEGSTGARLAVDRLCDGAFIGWCGLTRWNPDHRSASLGYCFDDAAWGHGYATEAARAGALVRLALLLAEAEGVAGWVEEHSDILLRLVPRHRCS